MKDVAPDSTSLRKAIQWISEQKRLEPQRKLMELVNEAAVKFDLSPKDSDFLFRHFSEEQKL
jgi:hypothetical protein